MDEYTILESMDGSLFLMHSGRSKRDGAKVGSGRYPLGSGDRPHQHDPKKPRSKKSYRRPDLSQLSDDEMQKAIRRENLEETYAKTFNLHKQDPVETTRTYSNAAKDSIRSLKKIEKMTRPKKEPLDLSSRSDEELRREINRANLERQYNDMFNNSEAEVSKGRRLVQNVLDTADTVADIATPFAMIAAMVYLGVKKANG